MNNIQKPILGILGGMGPMATAYFYELLVKHTKASNDNEHIDVMISGRSSTPDRTAFILGKSIESPLKLLCDDAQLLQRSGATVIGITCNTAHYFYTEISNSVEIKVLNMILETASFLNDKGAKRIAIMATEGTVRSGLYQMFCDKFQIEYVVPNKRNQERIMGIIYTQIKAGVAFDWIGFQKVIRQFEQDGCDHIILGCTELSLIRKSVVLDGYIIDPLEILAFRSIEECGKRPVGFTY